MATILEGLNAISQAVGGAGEAESNLEALNAISGALGGSADAENNAEAIANIAENASGGGGGDFTIAKVTFINNTSVGLTLSLPIVFTNKKTGKEMLVSERSILTNNTEDFDVPLYKGMLVFYHSYFEDGGHTVTSSGNAETGDGYTTITGDCTITIS